MVKSAGTESAICAFLAVICLLTADRFGFAEKAIQRIIANRNRRYSFISIMLRLSWSVEVLKAYLSDEVSSTVREYIH